MQKLLHFAESQKNVDAVASRLGMGLAAFGILLAIAIVVQLVIR
jgi:hypothetical protein